MVSSSSLNGVAKIPAQDFKIKILARQEGSDGVQYAGAGWPNPRTLSQTLYRHMQGEALIWISPTISPQCNFCVSKNLIKAFLCLIKPNPIDWFAKAFIQVTMSVFERKSRAKAGQTEAQGNGNRKATGTAMTLDATSKTYHGPILCPSRNGRAPIVPSPRTGVYPFLARVLAKDGHTKNRVIKEQCPSA